jgi:hypothetical protein
MSAPTFDDVLKKLDGIAAPPPHLGRALAHCAQSIECSVSGFPKMKPAWFQKTVGRLVLKKFLKQGFMRHNLTAPVPGAPELPETSFADGLAQLGAAIQKFRAHSGALAPHFAYGPVERADYERVHAMHVLDHLGPR